MSRPLRYCLNALILVALLTARFLVSVYFLIPYVARGFALDWITMLAVALVWWRACSWLARYARR